MEYFVMRKDEVITLCEINDDGMMITFSPRYRNPELAPLEFKAYTDHISRWWNNRKIPISQGKVQEMLKRRGIISPDEYLLKNLGLSLTDYYWIKPVDSSLTWADVNLFDNDFRENLMLNRPEAIGSADSFTPNSSLRGELEKSWIIREGKRLLIKGNHGTRSFESINEVIASEFHKAQRYDNYTKYRLAKIKGKEYNYACCSQAFTNKNVELVSAYALLTSEKKPEGESPYEFLIKMGAKYGLDPVKFRQDLEYQILSDYVLTNIDRHMDNIGILRDADTLKFIRMAPIFDTGKAFGGGWAVPYTDEEIDNVEINSFEHSETRMLEHLTDKGILDISKALSAETIDSLLSKDPKENRSHKNNCVRLYNKKLERLKRWQENKPII